MYFRYLSLSLLHLQFKPRRTHKDVLSLNRTYTTSDLLRRINVFNTRRLYAYPHLSAQEYIAQIHLLSSDPKT